MDGAPFPNITPIVFEHVSSRMAADASLLVASSARIVLVSSDCVMCYGNHPEDEHLSKLRPNLLGKAAL